MSAAFAVAAIQSTPAVCAIPSIINTPGNTGLPGKVSLEMRFVDRHVFDADTVFVAANVDHAIDHQKRVTMRQHLENGRNIRRLECCHDFVHDSRFTHRPQRRCRPSAAQVVRESSSRGTTA